jgi:hypothetical protein
LKIKVIEKKHWQLFPEKSAEQENKEYGANNTLVSRARADEIRKKLKAKLAQLNTQSTTESLSENPNDPNADQGNSETTLAGSVPGSGPTDAGTQRPGERSPSSGGIDVEGDGSPGNDRNDDAGSVAGEPGTVGVQESDVGLGTARDERDDRIKALWDDLVSQNLGETTPAAATVKKPRKPRTASNKPKATGQQVKEKAGHAASELAKAADKATDGLLNLFFTPGKLRSGPRKLDSTISAPSGQAASLAAAW